MKRDELNKRIDALLLKVPKSWEEMRKEIGVSSTCFRGFRRGQRDTNTKNLAKIEKYIIEQEALSNTHVE
jgi:septation ring formation regulator EzrA